MSQPDNTSWLPWLASIPGALILFFMKRIISSVSRADLREAIQDATKVVDDRHRENLQRFEAQDADLKEIRHAVARIEGQLSGRYPRIEK